MTRPRPRWYCSWVEKGRTRRLETDALPARIWPPGSNGKPPAGISERSRIDRHVLRELGR